MKKYIFFTVATLLVTQASLAEGCAQWTTQQAEFKVRSITDVKDGKPLLQNGEELLYELGEVNRLITGIVTINQACFGSEGSTFQLRQINIPAVLNARHYGLRLSVVASVNATISIYNLDGKKAKELLLPFTGVKAGASFHDFAGVTANGTLASNKSGIVLGDLEPIISWGLGLGASAGPAFLQFSFNEANITIENVRDAATNGSITDSKSIQLQDILEESL